MKEALIKYYIKGATEKEVDYIVFKSVLGIVTSYTSDKRGKCICNNTRRTYDSGTFEEVISELLMTINKSSPDACYEIVYMWSI